MRPQLQPKLSPSSKMVPRRHSPPNPLHSPHRPELRKASRALNRRRIDTLSRVDIVGSTVRSD